MLRSAWISLICSLPGVNLAEAGKPQLTGNLRKYIFPSAACSGFAARFALRSFTFCFLIVGALSFPLNAQTTYIEGTAKGPTTTATCNSTSLADSFLLTSVAGTTSTRTVNINASSLYGIGFFTNTGVPGLTSWIDGTYSLALDNTTTNANIKISDVCIARVSSTGASLTSVCHTGSINTALSTAALRTFNCQVTSALATSSTDRLLAIVVLQNVATSRQSVTLRSNGANDKITFTPASPQINTLTPTSGPAGGSVTIAGTAFGLSTGTVKFNGVTATVSSWSDTSIVTTVPSAATTGSVIVTAGGVSSNGVTFTVASPPSVSSIAPLSGAAGTPVTITGSNFGTPQGTGTVKFNGTAATVASWTTTSISASVPPLATSGNIIVTTSAGLASNGTAFTIPAPSISSISPGTAPAGTSVTVTGTNFGSTAGTLTFNGTAATPASWSNTQIVVPVPASAATGPVIVTQGGPSNSFTFTVVPPSTISSVSPTSGPANTVVTILGSHFGIPQGTGSVNFNGTLTTPISWGDTQIVAPVPAGATTGAVTVISSTGSTSNGVPFTVSPGPSITSLSPATGAPGTTVTITGQNFGASQGSSVVRFNGAAATVIGWSATSISVTVPSAATTGPVTVTVSGVASAGATFTAITSGTLSGSVTNSTGGTAISGATVQALQAGTVKSSTTTTAGGAYSMTNLAAGSYDIQVSASSFGTALKNSVSILGGQTTAANFSLSAPGSITGKVTRPDGVTAIVGAGLKIFVGSAAGSSTTADSSGNYSLTGLNAGSYTIETSATGYVTRSQTVAVTGGSATTTNIVLQPVSANPVKYVYDELGRLVAVIDPSGDEATYTYDAVGNILSIARQSASLASVISFSPRKGTIGTSVTINGTGFSATAAQDSVSFNGVTAVIVSATATQILASVPATATTGPITVTSPAGSVTTANAFTVLADSGAPTISSFTPSIGLPGTAVTISGTNYDSVLANNRAHINLSEASITSAAPTTLGVIVPSLATSGRISVATAAGKAASTQDFFVPFNGHAVGDVGFTGRMTLGLSQSISLPTPGKVGIIVFDAAAGQRASVQITSSTFTACTLYLFDPFGNQLASSACTGTGNFLDGPTLPSAGTYTLGLDPGGTTGNVSFTLNNATDVTGIISPGTPVSFTTTVPGQNARYTFNGFAGQQISLLVTNSTYAGCIALTAAILKQDGSTLSSGSTCGNSIFLDSMTLPSAGTYTVLIDPPVTSSGSATIQLNTFTDISGAITIGTPLTVTTTGIGQNARYTFSGTAGQQISMVLSNSTYTGCIALTGSILKPDGSALNSTATCGASSFLDSTTLPVTGTYTVLVDPGGTATGQVTVLLNTFTDITGTTGIGLSFTATTTTAGQNARYTFSGTAGQQITLNLTDSTYAGCVALSASVLNPDGTTLSSGGTCGTSLFLNSMTLAVTGTYTVLVDPGGTATGTVNGFLNTFGDISGTIAFGTPLTVTTTAAGQKARYTFSATTGQQISLTLSNSTYTGCVALSASVLKPDGTTLGSTATCGATGFIDSLTVPAAGTYTVLIAPGGTATGSVTVQLNTFTDINGTVSIGTPLTVTTTGMGQNARYTFSGITGQQISLTLSGSTYAGCVALSTSILKPDGTTLGSTATCGATGFIDSMTMPVGGTYTLFVDPGGIATGNATLQINTFSDISGTTTIGTPLNVTTTGLGQNARYTFSAASGQQLSLTITNSAYAGCIALSASILKPDGTTLGSTGICGATGFIDSITAPVAGTYTLFVDPGGTATGSATLQINTFSDISGTTTIGTPLNVTTTGIGQNARYTFSATAGQQLSLTLNNSTYAGCIALSVSILNPDGTTLGSTGICGATGFIDSLTAPVTGTYTVVVNPGGTATGSVTVLINSFTDIVGSIASGTPLNVTTTTAGQNARFTFSGTAAQQATLNLAGSTYTGCIALTGAILKPDGTTLNSTGICGASGSFGPVALPLSGTYTVLVDPGGTATGSVTVTLTLN
jgi:YD repeat-containing protein